MNPGHDLDAIIAREVMGSSTPKPYSTSMDAAFEVMQKLGVTLIPIEGGQWFAFIGPNPGWKSPGEFLQFLGKADFNKSGAAVHESAPYSVCIAAWNAVQQRQIAELSAEVKNANGPKLGLVPDTGVTH